MRSGSLPAGSLTPCIRRGNVSSLSQGFLSEERLSLHEFVSRVSNIFRFDRKGRVCEGVFRALFQSVVRLPPLPPLRGTRMKLAETEQIDTELELSVA